MPLPSWSTLLVFLDQPAVTIRVAERNETVVDGPPGVKTGGRSFAFLSVTIALLILLAEGLDVCFAVRVEEFLAALLPRRFEFGRCDVPVRPAFPGHGTQVLAEFFQSGPGEEPVAHVDLINDQARFEDNRVGDHGIVERISVLGDVEIFLDFTSRVGEERPVGTDSGAIFIRLSDVVGANRDQPAIADLNLTMKLNKPFMLPAVLGAVPSAAEDENHWMLLLQFGKLPAFRGVIGKLIVGEDSP